MHPLVSISIPVYNGANYMREAIDSALNQTYPNIEVLVINDGSQDEGKTEEIALSYGNRVRYFSKPNGGVASALNLALAKASGDYFCWLSHDDIYFPDKIEKEMQVLLGLSNPSSVVFCHFSIMDSEGKYLYDAQKPPKFEPRQAAYQLILGQWLHCCTILAPKCLYLESGGFREDLPTTQDYDLLVKIGLKHPFVEIPEVLLSARSHPEQGSLTLGHLKEVEAFFGEHIPMLSREYMYANFTPEKSVEAFLKLGAQMQSQNFADAVLISAKQLLCCEAQRAEPELLWDVVYRLTVEYYPLAMQRSKNKIDKLSTPLYAESKIKILARRWLPAKAWNTLRKLRISLRQSSTFSQEPTQNKELMVPATIDFDEIYKKNGFEGTESRSGEGSSLFQTRIIREDIPKLFKELEISQILDIPCGDWHWMQHVDLKDVFYIGGDIVRDIIDRNNEIHGNQNCKFEYLNLIEGPLPAVDLIICRDCLVHLNFKDGLEALEKIRNSGSTWLLTTTFTKRSSNKDLYTNEIWRPLNLECAPYNLPKPERYLVEGCTEGFGEFDDKCLGLWKISYI